MEDEIIIDDLIILGRAAPDEIKDGRTTICVGGYSHSLGFIRIYPTKTDTPIKRWDVVKLPVERNPKDTRKESWKIKGSKNEWNHLSEKIEVVDRIEDRKKRAILIGNLVDNCIKKINEEKRSLGIIKPDILEFYFSERSDVSKNIQSKLLTDKLIRTKKNYPIQPRLNYECEKCKNKNPHDQQLLEWGAYEWIRKNPMKPEQLWENYRLENDEYETYFLVGNQALHRTSFLVISIIWFKNTPIEKTLTPLKKAPEK